MQNEINLDKYKKIIEEIWQYRDNHHKIYEIKEDILYILSLLDQGKVRVAEKINHEWVTHQWLKKTILLSFAIFENQLIKTAENIGYCTYDKIPLKTCDWNENDFKIAGFRAVPGSIIRSSSYIGNNVVLMPSFVNIGAHIGDGTMVDTWATIGSCAQIGRNCHISGGVGIGGVLEPLQENPVIIEDNCFIGARSEIVDGVIIEEGSVIAMGVYLGSSTKIIDRQTGEISYGRVKAGSVVVPGSYTVENNPKISINAAIIIKKVDNQTRAKTSINELLRNI